VNRPGAAVVLPKEPEAGPPLPPMAYEPKGRRDPFSPVQLARETGGINVSSVKLVGVIQGRHGLLALVEAPDGIGYILRNGDVLGDGRVTAIAPTSITFAVVPRGAQRAQAVTLRLPVD
jgi:Tfp pilus assembly protein PilP